MAPVAPIAIAIGSSMIGSAIASAIGTAVIGAALSAGLSVGAGIAISSVLGSLAGGLIGLGANALSARAFSSSSASVSGSYGQGILYSNTQPSFTAQAKGQQIIIRSTVESRKVIYGRQRVSGPLVYVETQNTGPVQDSSESISSFSGDNPFVHLVIPLAGHEVDAMEQVYLDDVLLTLNGQGYATNAQYVGKDGEVSGKRLVRIKLHLGSPDQAADSDLISECPNWTSAHRLRGVAYIYIRLQYSVDAFPNGIPQVRVVVRGKKIFDPRTNTTAYSTNAALCIRDYITSQDYGLGALVPDDVDEPNMIAAANLCDESVALRDGTSQKRYTCNAIIDTASKRIDNLKILISATAGCVTYSQGLYRCFPAAYNTPTVTIDESWLAGEMGIDTSQPTRDVFNSVKGVYQDPTQQWQPIDFPEVTSGTYVAEDGGEKIYNDIELPCVDSPARAQRIAKILLEKSRQGIIVDMQCNFKALRLSVYDTVYLNNEIMGFVQKPFRVVSWAFAANGAGINVTMQEESAASYNWVPGDDEIRYDPAPNTNLPSAFSVAPPGNPNVSEALYISNNSAGLKVRATVYWTASPDFSVIRYVVQYRQVQATDWIAAGDTVSTSLDIFDVEPDKYEFRVKAVNTIGQSSDWVSTIKDIQGKTIPPEKIQNFSVNEINANAHLSWTQSEDLDVKTGGFITLRYSPDVVGATWSESVAIGPSLPGVATSAVVPLLSGTYLIKAVDSSGIESNEASTIVVDVTNVVNINFVAALTEDPTFPGSKVGMNVVSGSLILDDAVLFDDTAGNFDDKTGNFDDAGGGLISTAGTYYFSNYIDMGDVYRARTTIEISASVYDAAATFDVHSGNFDDATGFFDGEDITGVNAKLYVRTTDDNPAGTPTWGDWRQFIVGDYTCRALQFKLEVTSSNSSYNIAVDRLRVQVDVPDRTERGEDFTTNAGGSTISFTKPFFAIPNIGIIMQDGNTGDYYKITAKTLSSFTIRCFNAAGTGVARKIDWIALAY